MKSLDVLNSWGGPEKRSSESSSPARIKKTEYFHDRSGYSWLFGGLVSFMAALSNTSFLPSEVYLGQWRGNRFHGQPLKSRRQVGLVFNHSLGRNFGLRCAVNVFEQGYGSHYLADGSSYHGEWACCSDSAAPTGLQTVQYGPGSIFGFGDSMRIFPHVLAVSSPRGF